MNRDPWELVTHNAIDDPVGTPIWVNIFLFWATAFVSLCGTVLMLLILHDYVSFVVKAASLLAHWEERIIVWLAPSTVYWLWSLVPLTLRHILAWLTWAKYLYITVIVLRYYTTFFMRATSITTVSFVDVLPCVVEDSRPFTFRNQDLLIGSCPVMLSFERRVFGIIPIMYETRAASATMIMELTAHKFLNGAVELPDTADRINRAMKAIGYINLDATDVFRNHDMAEISRLTAISWAKARLEANYGLRMQDF